MKKNLKKGFVPALGTPLDENGVFLKDSYLRQINMMLSAGAVGLLSMGSMGIQATLRFDQCRSIAQACVEAADGKVPVYVGAMDCGIVRAKERIASMEDLPIEGFVFTTPYYNVLSPRKALNYFKAVASATAHKVYLYDLPGVTQCKITYDMVMELIRTVPNLGGIKTADINMIRKLMLNPEVPAHFEILFSGLDMFDVAYSYGVCTNLDGMFTCVPRNSEKMYQALDAGDEDTAAQCLTNIISLRDHMLTLDLMPAYTAAMNLLGCEGIFNQDYCDPYTDAVKASMKEAMTRIGEL